MKQPYEVREERTRDKDEDEEDVGVSVKLQEGTTMAGEVELLSPVKVELPSIKVLLLLLLMKSRTAISMSCCADVAVVSVSVVSLFVNSATCVIQNATFVVNNDCTQNAAIRVVNGDTEGEAGSGMSRCATETRLNRLKRKGSQVRSGTEVMGGAVGGLEEEDDDEEEDDGDEEGEGEEGVRDGTEAAGEEVAVWSEVGRGVVGVPEDGGAVVRGCVVA